MFKKPYLDFLIKIDFIQFSYVYIRDCQFSKYANFSEKVTFLIPCYAHIYVYTRVLNFHVRTKWIIPYVRWLIISNIDKPLRKNFQKPVPGKSSKHWSHSNSPDISKWATNIRQFLDLPSKFYLVKGCNKNYSKTSWMFMDKNQALLENVANRFGITMAIW